MKEQIAQIFQNNLNNKLTLELANGMISAIFQLLPQEPANVDNTAATTSNEPADSLAEGDGQRG
ncbi:MAG: hypothetical protein E6Q59_03915 [Nitrosomonas sp.]|nr:MAG: hypothetical protein E6Q59_03915 [Nitrosomonas sp.]